MANTTSQVLMRAGHRCEYCLAPQAIGVPIFLDHIQPRSLGGGDTLDNLCAACERCNAYKSDFVFGVDVETDETTPLFNPRIDRWAEHFEWNEDYTQIIAISPVGRVTVKRLKMNTSERQSQRLLWIRAGVHPPA